MKWMERCSIKGLVSIQNGLLITGFILCILINFIDSPTVGYFLSMILLLIPYFFWKAESILKRKKKRRIKNLNKNIKHAS